MSHASSHRPSRLPDRSPGTLFPLPLRLAAVSIALSLLTGLAVVAFLVASGNWDLVTGSAVDTSTGTPTAPPTAAADPAGTGPHAVPVVFRAFAAVTFICVAAHLGGWLARRLGQPKVVGEILAGLLISPSVLGRLLPELASTLFPADVRAIVEVLAQCGLVLFMFHVGTEFDTRVLRRQGTSIALLSQAAMVVPFLLGVLAGPLIYPSFAGDDVGAPLFVFFMGTVISVTAFPVLARLVQESGLKESRLGTLALAAAGIIDVLTWCALAGVLALATASSPTRALWSLPLAALFVALIFLVVRPLLARAADRFGHLRLSASGRMALLLVLVFTFAALTELIGVHAIFGAFLAGMVLPLQSTIFGNAPQRVTSTSRDLLLPVFFASIGLQIDVIGAVGNASMLLAGLLVLGLAVLGKLASAGLCARAGGMPWRESLGLGLLLNARGVTEIVILQAGLSNGLINSKGFAVLVFVALITTIMTAPLLRLLRLRPPDDEWAATRTTPQVLVEYENPVAKSELGVHAAPR